MLIADIFLYQPLFPGENALDQLIKIVKVLGTLMTVQIIEMNQNYADGSRLYGAGF